MKAYYARPISIYNTPEEFRDLDLLGRLGYTVLDFTEGMEERAQTEGMAPFVELVLQEADIMFFRAFPCGRIGAGVAAEIRAAQTKGIPVLELPQLPSWRVMSREDTRYYLRAAGQR